MSVANQSMSIFIAAMIGCRSGTNTRMIAGHSNGQPSRKMTTMMSGQHRHRRDLPGEQRVGGHRRRPQPREHGAEHVAADGEEDDRAGLQQCVVDRVLEPLPRELPVDDGQERGADDPHGGRLGGRRPAPDDRAEGRDDEDGVRQHAQRQLHGDLPDAAGSLLGRQRRPQARVDEAADQAVDDEDAGQQEPGAEARGVELGDGDAHDRAHHDQHDAGRHEDARACRPR